MITAGIPGDIGIHWCSPSPADVSGGTSLHLKPELRLFSLQLVLVYKKKKKKRKRKGFIFLLIFLQIFPSQTGEKLLNIFHPTVASVDKSMCMIFRI